LYIDSSGNYHGFVYSNGTYTTVDPAGSVFTDVMSINNSGQVSGYYEDSGGHCHGFLATPATTMHPAGTSVTQPASPLSSTGIPIADVTLLVNYMASTFVTGSDGYGASPITETPPTGRYKCPYRLRTMDDVGPISAAFSCHNEIAFMPARRFPPPWSVDDPDMKLGQDCYIVREANRHALA
jgi:hypothetical protein